MAQQTSPPSPGLKLDCPWSRQTQEQLGETACCATFIQRPNRFVALIQLENGEAHRAHVPDPGRLIELLSPGVALWVVSLAPSPTRKLRWRVELVQTQSGTWVCLHTQRANASTLALLEAKALPSLSHYNQMRSEQTWKHSRFDFHLSQSQSPSEAFLEVKAVSYVQQGIARFPDAPTKRGVKHLKALSEWLSEEASPLSPAKREAFVCFCLQRGDAQAIRPFAERDPQFAEALASSQQQGVKLIAYGLDMSPDACLFLGERPVVL